jgi:hypothetical protein
LKSREKECKNRFSFCVKFNSNVELDAEKEGMYFVSRNSGMFVSQNGFLLKRTNTADILLFLNICPGESG